MFVMTAPLIATSTHNVGRRNAFACEVMTQSRPISPSLTQTHPASKGKKGLYGNLSISNQNSIEQDNSDHDLSGKFSRDQNPNPRIDLSRGQSFDSQGKLGSSSTRIDGRGVENRERLVLEGNTYLSSSFYSNDSNRCH